MRKILCTSETTTKISDVLLLPVNQKEGGFFFSNDPINIYQLQVIKLGINMWDIKTENGEMEVEGTAW